MLIIQVLAQRVHCNSGIQRTKGRNLEMKQILSYSFRTTAHARTECSEKQLLHKIAHKNYNNLAQGLLLLVSI